MPSMEFERWKAFYQIEPFGPKRDNLHAGLIASILTNINRKKGTPATTANDFVFIERDELRRRNTMQTIATMRAMAKNGRK